MWHRIWINFGQLVLHVVIYLSAKFFDDLSCVRRLETILVLGFYRGLVRVLCFEA